MAGRYVRVGCWPVAEGLVSSASVHVCPKCNGETKVEDDRATCSDIQYRPCPTCKGKGFVVA